MTARFHGLIRATIRFTALARYNEDAKGIYIDGVTKHEEGDWMHSWGAV